MTNTSNGHHEVIIVGGGQAGLATAYYLLRDSVDTLILDNGVQAGGAWNMRYPGMALLSDSTTASLPGLSMPEVTGPLRPEHLIEYLTNYEGLFDIPVRRPVRVQNIQHSGGTFSLSTDQGTWTANQVIMATGTWARPLVPHYEGSIIGQFWHAANYPGPEVFAGTSVAVMGAGQSGAEIVAELSELASVTWLTLSPPRYLPGDVTGPEVIRQQVERGRAQLAGEEVAASPWEEGDIVMTPIIEKALAAGRMQASPVPGSLDELNVNHFIWATGYEMALGAAHQILDAPGLHVVGDGTGAGSDTIAGVGQWAEHVAARVRDAREPS